jgi:hypothetical protein
MPATQLPPAEVLYDPKTGTITVDPDPIPVPQGTFVLSWIPSPKSPTDSWYFTGFSIDAAQGCFSGAQVQPAVITSQDKNEGGSCQKTFKYSLTLFDETSGHFVTVDPLIENQPG